MSTEQSSTAASLGWTTVELGTIKLGPTTYRVEQQRFPNTGGHMTWLYGPRGAVYFLRGFAYRVPSQDTGVHQVISWKSGAPLRSKGNEIRVRHIGDIIEQA